MNCVCGCLKQCERCRRTVLQCPGATRRDAADGFALLQAAQNGDERAVRGLLERGVPADRARTRRLETALFLAAEHGHADVVRALLEHGADPSVPNENGAGAITQAAAAGRVDLINLMMQHQPAAFLETAALLAMHQASLGPHPGALKALLRGGAPARPRRPNLSLVLPSAAITCPTCVRILLREGADPNWVDHRGRTALHWAARANKENCVRVLVAAGARVDARNADDRQPWQETRSDSLRKLLLCFLHSQSLAGSTPPRPPHPPQPSPRHDSQSSSLARSKKQLSSKRIGECAPQNLQSAGSAGPSDTASPGAPSSQDASPRPAAGPSGETSTGAPSSQDASPRPAAGPSGETSPGAASSQCAPACSAAGPSGVTSPGTSTSSNDAPATAGAEPSGESPPTS